MKVNRELMDVPETKEEKCESFVLSRIHPSVDSDERGREMLEDIIFSSHRRKYQVLNGISGE